MSKISHQALLECLFNKNQLMPRMRQEFSEVSEFYSLFARADVSDDFGIDFLVQLALHKRCNLPTLVGCLRHHYGDSQSTADAILRCIEIDLADWDTVTRMCITRFAVSQDVEDDLRRYQFPFPMVIEPRKITNNRETGYLENYGSVILKNNHHDDDICLDHLNRVNKIKFVINDDTANMIKNSWRNLDKPKTGESIQEWKDRIHQFNRYDFYSRDVIKLILKEGNTFWLTHKYDKRGRTYCQGYHINYQGTAWNKAVVEFADKEVIS